MTETVVSLKTESYNAIKNFLYDKEFPVTDLIIDGLVSVVNLISDYHEEGVALFPDVLLITNRSFFSTLASNKHFCLCEEEISDKSFSMAIKMCAPLALNGWNIYLLLKDEHTLQYGIVNAELTQMSMSLYDQVTLTSEGSLKYAYFRNIGDKNVEIIGESSRCKISLNLGGNKVNIDDILDKLISVILKRKGVDYKIMSETVSYLKGMFINAFDCGHGNLVAVTEDVEQLKKGKQLQNGVYLTERIDFPAMMTDNFNEHSDNTATVLNAMTKLTISMLNFDGITLFDTEGCVVGYHFIVNNQLKEEKAFVGGSRTRAFNALCQTDGIIASFMKSQDGKINFWER